MTAVLILALALTGAYAIVAHLRALNAEADARQAWQEAGYHEETARGLAAKLNTSARWRG